MASLSKTISGTKEESDEISRLRLVRGIKYLETDVFNRLFPVTNTNAIGSGTSAHVFESTKKYIVKSFRTEPSPSYTNLVGDLSGFSITSHPNILKPLAWSMCTEGFGCIAMDYGENIVDAYLKDKITAEQIASDVASALAHLNKLGFAHSDVKPENIIFVDGRAMLIDMNLSREAQLYPVKSSTTKTNSITKTSQAEEEYFITGSAYTPGYLDPEYHYKQQNSIKAEVYALGATMMAITETTLSRTGAKEIFVPNFGELYIYSSKNPNIAKLINAAKQLVENRPSMTEIFNLIKVGEYPEQKEQKIEIPKKTDCGEAFLELLRWMIKQAYDNDMLVKTLFLALHLTHRAFNGIKEIYGEDYKKVYKLFGMVILNIAFNVIEEDTISTSIIETLLIKEGSRNPNSKTPFSEVYRNMLIDVLDTLKCVILTKTLFHYIDSKEDILLALEDMVDCNFNFSQVRIASSPGKDNEKCILIRKAIGKNDWDNYGKIRLTISFETFELDQITPCRKEPETDIKFVEELWFERKFESKNINRYITVLLRNRKVLNNLSTEKSLKIFSKLLEYSDKEIVAFTLDKICGFNWIIKGKTVIRNNQNPFIVKEADITESRNRGRSEQEIKSLPIILNFENPEFIDESDAGKWAFLSTKNPVISKETGTSSSVGEVKPSTISSKGSTQPSRGTRPSTKSPVRESKTSTQTTRGSRAVTEAVERLGVNRPSGRASTRTSDTGSFTSRNNRASTTSEAPSSRGNRASATSEAPPSRSSRNEPASFTARSTRTVKSEPITTSKSTYTSRSGRQISKAPSSEDESEEAGTSTSRNSRGSPLTESEEEPESESESESVDEDEGDEDEDEGLDWR